MLRFRTISLLVVLLAFPAGLVACGGDDVDKDEYVDKVNEAQTEFTQEAGKLNLANPESARGFVTSLNQLDGVLDKLIKDLEDTEAPDDVQSEHDKLISSLRDYDKTLTDEKGDLTSGSRTKVVAAAQEIARGSQEFQTTFSATISDINEKLQD